MLKRLRNLVATPAVEQRAAFLAGQQITYTLKRSGKRRSIGLRIDDRGLTVSMPLRASEKWLHSVLQDKARWVVEKLDGWQSRKPAEICWADGERIPFLGEQLTLRVARSLFAAPDETTGETTSHSAQQPEDGCQAVGYSHSTRLANNASQITGHAQQRGSELWIFVADDSETARIEQAVSFWYQREAERLFAERTAHFAALLNVVPRSVKLSAAKTQWGCCTARGSVRLNLQLIKLPLTLIDYVVVHELAHLREMNHSASFWSVVECVCPDYARLRRELKTVALS